MLHSSAWSKETAIGQFYNFANYVSHAILFDIMHIGKWSLHKSCSTEVLNKGM